MLKIDQFDYTLDSDKIAQKPISPRDHSKLLVLNRREGTINHHQFYQLDKILTKKDVLVRNNTKVIPARIYGQKKNTHGKVEILLTKRIKTNQNSEIWECLTKPGIKEDQVIRFAHSQLTAKCLQNKGYTRSIKFNQSKTDLFITLDKIGHTPIPPYITWENNDQQELKKLYQTTYAKIKGSAAAPTAGFHFTPDLDQRLKNKGIKIYEVTLHVGLGTFLPVKTKNIEDHHMHKEWFELKKNTAEKLNQEKNQGKNIISVGTTSTRVLETCSNHQGVLQARSQETGIYIYPPYKFKFVNNLITNLHLPKSTLLMLISALTSYPNTQEEFTDFKSNLAGQAYQAAIKHNYRFYSFGDAMLIR